MMKAFYTMGAYRCWPLPDAGEGSTRISSTLELHARMVAIASYYGFKTLHTTALKSLQTYVEDLVALIKSEEISKVLEPEDLFESWKQRLLTDVALTARYVYGEAPRADRTLKDSLLSLLAWNDEEEWGTIVNHLNAPVIRSLMEPCPDFVLDVVAFLGRLSSQTNAIGIGTNLRTAPM